MQKKAEKKLSKKDVQFISRLERLPSAHVVGGKLVLIFKRRLPSGNKLASHWGANASYKKGFLKDLGQLRARSWLWFNKVKLTAYRYSPKRLDLTNQTIKPLEDAIKEYGLIPDDTQEHVVSITIKEVISKEKKTILVLEEV